MSGPPASSIFSAAPFQMTGGERAALYGLIADRRPGLAIELGTAEGGSLSVLAQYAAEVHSFDLVRPSLAVAELPHVHLHTGDSHVLLPELLRKLEAAGRHVDFALVDGDHSAEGARRDVEDLLASDACQTTVIVMHDAAAPEVRRGLDEIGLDRHPKVGFVDLDLISGVLFERRLQGQIWGGLGVAVLGPGEGGSSFEYHRPVDVLNLARTQLYPDA